MRETAQSGAATLKSSAEQRLVKQLAAQRRALQTQPVAACTPVFCGADSYLDPHYTARQCTKAAALCTQAEPKPSPCALQAVA